ncbi:MAG: M1 family aminopeptidase, partial [Acidobacteriota bacterium]
EPLFAGAGWMHQNLPPDATVGAWNAGILSYFSQRQVVNLDGLVNSRSFFLADRHDLCAYLDRVGIDYLVDAFDEEQPFDPYKEQIGLCTSDFEPVWDGPGYRSSPRRAMAFRRLETMIYTLDLRPDFETRVLQGRASIRLPPSSVATGAIELPAPKLQIRSARLNGVDLTFEKVGRGWRMALTPDQVRATAATDQAAAASLRLDLDYLAPAAAGLVFGEEYVHTAFFACHWLPCIGPDLDRASIEIRLDLPVGYRSVASGQPLAQTTPGQHGWRQTQPYPLYTLGFAAGRFKEIADTASGTRLRYLALNDDAAALRAKFADSPRVLEFFEGKAGLPLPHPIYTQVLVPGSVAQEASSFSLIGHRMLDPIIDDPQEDWVIAHEMAHQWWGNLVTCASWDELWLNEGLAVFMTAAWKQHRWGEAAYGRELDLFHQTWSRARAAGFDKPLSWPGQYPSLRMKRSIHYSKAALFLHALREELGESVFWQGLRRYTRDYAGRSVRAADFQAAMEQAAGRSLQSIFETWVYGAEPPKR